MAFAHGRAGGFSCKDSSTTWRNLSQYLSNVDFSQVADTAEVTTFGTTGSAKVYLPGNKDATFSISGKWDPTPDGWLNGILSKSKSYTYYVNSTASSNTSFVRYTGTAICSGYGPGTSVDDAVSFTAEFQNTGKITRSTASS